MRLIIDAMSGDNAPLEIVKGAYLGAQEFGVDVTLVGDKKIIKAITEKEKLFSERVSVVHSQSVIDMCDDPIVVLKSKKDSSMSIGFSLLKEGEGDAFISAGNTGAVLTGASLILRKIKGIKRAAIGALIPLSHPMLLIDSGANVEVKAEYLKQFAIMGSVYMKHMFSIASPKIALINNGAESTKGTELYRDTYKELKNTDEVNFIGNIEGRDVPTTQADVIVCDGFTGNIVLKLVEGFGKFMSGTLREMFMSGLKTKVAAILMKKQIGRIKKKFDHAEYGGAPLLGVSAPVIKAHGSSNAKAIKSAMAQAISFSRSGIVQEIACVADKFRKQKEDVNN